MAMESEPLVFDRATADKLDRLLLLHVWVMVPFALVWYIWPDRFGSPGDPQQIEQMRWLFLAIFSMVGIRTWAVLTRNRSMPWNYVWPIADVAFLAAATNISHARPDSWLIALYLLPVLTAATTLNLKWAITVALLGAGSCVLTQGSAELQYSYGAFRLFFLVVVASLATRVAIEAALNQRRLAIAEYQSELAREAHDGLQQLLGAITMRLELVERMRASNPEEAAKLASEQREVARRANDELRVMIRRLRSPELGSYGLKEALEEQAKLLRERIDADVVVEVHGTQISAPPRIEHALLRIASEALNNVAKHASPTSVRVSLTYSANELTLEIKDDGAGFEPELANGDGLGLGSIRDRAALIGGTADIAASPGSGTCVKVKVPLAPKQGRRA